MDTHSSGYMYGHTHGSRGTCMDTDMVVGVHVWTHIAVGVMYGHIHGLFGYIYGHTWGSELEGTGV